MFTEESTETGRGRTQRNCQPRLIYRCKTDEQRATAMEVKRWKLDLQPIQPTSAVPVPSSHPQQAGRRAGSLSLRTPVHSRNRRRLPGREGTTTATADAQVAAGVPGYKACSNNCGVSKLKASSLNNLTQVPVPDLPVVV